MPAWSWNVLGTGIGARPRVRIAGGGDGYRRSAPSKSGSTEAHGHEFCGFAGLHSHQNRAFAVLLRSIERAAHIGRVGDLLARHFENDVAGLEALIGSEDRKSTRLNSSHLVI